MIQAYSVVRCSGVHLHESLIIMASTVRPGLLRIFQVSLPCKKITQPVTEATSAVVWFTLLASHENCSTQVLQQGQAHGHIPFFYGKYQAPGIYNFHLHIALLDYIIWSLQGDLQIWKSTIHNSHSCTNAKEKCIPSKELVS